MIESPSMFLASALQQATLPNLSNCCEMHIKIKKTSVISLVYIQTTGASLNSKLWEVHQAYCPSLSSYDRSSFYGRAVMLSLDSCWPNPHSSVLLMIDMESDESHE